MSAITDVPGLRVGHWTDERARTGCTVVLVDGGGVAGVSVRGGAPGTRETDLLDPQKLAGVAHAFVLSGGSAYGLAAADGVMRWLEERGVGVRVGPAIVPIVPAAIIFDLAVGDGSVRPDSAAGYAACETASADPPAEGAVGAGTGATIAKLLGRESARRGGVGTASLRIGDATVAALFVVNAVGDVVEDDGTLVGAPEGTPRIADEILRGTPPQLKAAPRESTTIGVVATDAPLTKSDANVLAGIANDGMARAIRPAHGRLDGDTIFAVSTGAGAPVDVDVLAIAACEVTARAIRRAVR